jgi:hypothetical protein
MIALYLLIKYLIIVLIELKSVSFFMSLSEDKVLYTASSASKSAMALATGFQYLLETVKLVNQHLGLGQELQLSAIHAEYLAWNIERGHLDEGVLPST